MLKALRIKTAGGGVTTMPNRAPHIRTTQGVTKYCVDNNVVLNCDTVSSYGEWYASFISSKALAMRSGGSSENYNFTGISGEGIANDNPLNVWKSCVRLIQDTISDDKGAISLISDKYVDVSVDETDKSCLIVTRTSDFFEPNYYYVAIQRLLMYLYNSINYQADRLRIAESDITADTVKLNNNSYPIVQKPYEEFGPRLNTIGNYQAIVARWNHFAWTSSMVMDIDSSASTCAISLGYVCLDCFINRLTIACKLEYKGLYIKGSDYSSEGITTEDVRALSNNYTIYHMGTSSTVPKAVTRIVTLRRNGTACDGTGYMGGTTGDRLNNAELHITLSGESNEPVMRAEQSHYETFSIAVPSGSLEHYSPQVATAYVHVYEITTNWIVNDDDRKSFNKTGYVEVPAVNVIEVNKPDDPENKPVTPV